MTLPVHESEPASPQDKSVNDPCGWSAPPVWLNRLTAIYFVVALAALLLPFPFRGRLWTAVADLMHIPAFAIFNLLALLVARRCLQPSSSLPPEATTESPSLGYPEGLSDAGRSGSWGVPLVVTAAVIGFSGIVELLQGMLSRQASLGDLLRNTLGALVALAVYYALFTQRPAVRGLCLAAVAALIALAISGPVSEIRDVQRQAADFPQLATFRSHAELNRWFFSAVDIDPQSATSGQLTGWFHPADFPAIQLQQMQRDWTGYDALVTELRHDSDSPSQQITIQLRLTDRAGWRRHQRGLFRRIDLQRGQSFRWEVDLRAEDGQQLRWDEMLFVEYQLLDLATAAKVSWQSICLTGPNNR